jgi:hypothetical protein
MKYWDTITERLPKEPIRWPNGARIAVLSLFDYQAEVSEWTFPDGTPNYGQITESSYGGRVGIWRLLDICDKHGVKATFNTCGITAERYPESVRAIVDRGHEIAGHTYTHRAQFTLSYDEELEEIRKTVNSIKRITGARIVGWRCPIVQPSKNTSARRVWSRFRTRSRLTTSRLSTGPSDRMSAASPVLGRRRRRCSSCGRTSSMSSTRSRPNRPRCSRSSSTRSSPAGPIGRSTTTGSWSMSSGTKGSGSRAASTWPSGG